MSRKSTMENKTVYQLAREKLNLTREGTEAMCPALTADRIVKIEHGKTTVQP